MLRYLRDDDGASAAEYAIILGVLGAAVAVSIYALGAGVSSRFASATAVLASTGSPEVAPTDPAPPAPPGPTVCPGNSGGHGNGKGNNCK